MSWQSVTLTVAGHEVETLTDALVAAGALSVDVSDADAGTAAETALFGEPGAIAAPWARSTLKVLFGADADAEAALVVACEAAGVDFPATIERRVVDDQDWVRLTQSQFKPIRISSRLWIVPSWETAPDPAAINLVLDPGAAFGTGSHATTRLCLRWLLDHVRAGERVLDYGCGSGILAIAALRLGAGHAVGVDIDPQAVLAARANAMQNRVGAEFYEPGGEPALRFDIVLANILANPLIALSPLLAAATRPGGSIVLSGVLESQAEDVVRAYSAWFDMKAPVVDEGWTLLTGRRTG
jgi:ribosomal protein L11 methyltransferase